MGDHGTNDVERRARIKETMAELARSHEAAVARVVADEIARQRRIDQARRAATPGTWQGGDVGTAVFKVAFLAVVDESGLQPAYDGLPLAINAELERSCEDFRVGANDLEKLVTSVVVAKRECRLVDLLFSTKNQRTPAAEHAVVRMITDLGALAVVSRDSVGGGMLFIRIHPTSPR